MTSNAAKWSRDFRRRRREGLVPLRVEVPEVELVETLRIAGFIGEDEADPEPEQLARLLEHVIRLWVMPTGERP
jgi:hypothetical protein